MMAKKAPNPIDKHVGSRVRMRRMMLSMSQEKLGDALGLTFQQVQKYEKGTNRIGASRLQQISNILQVPVAFFFEGAPAIRGAVAGRHAGSPVSGLCVGLPRDLRGVGADQGLHADQGGEAPPPRGRTGEGDRRRSRRRRMKTTRPSGLLGSEQRLPTRAHILTPSGDAARTAARSALAGLPLVSPRAGRRSAFVCRPGTAFPETRSASPIPSILRGSVFLCHAPTICSPASPFPKGTPTRSATRFRTRSSMPSSRMTSSSASPTTARSTRGSAARRSAPPTRS